MYIYSLDTIYILNALTLDEIASFTIEADAIVTCVQVKDNIIYVSYNTSDSVGRLNSYDRNSLDFISTISNTVSLHLSVFTVYNGVNQPDTHQCMRVPTSTTGEAINVDTFNDNGVFQNSITNQTDSYFNVSSTIRTNDNTDYVLLGRYATIYNKEDYATQLFNQDFNYLSENDALRDFRITADGHAIYVIKDDDFAVHKYSGIDFTYQGSTPISIDGRYLFIDNNELIVIDYFDNFPERQYHCLCLMNNHNFQVVWEGQASNLN